MFDGKMSRFSYTRLSFVQRSSDVLSDDHDRGSRSLFFYTMKLDRMYTTISIYTHWVNIYDGTKIIIIIIIIKKFFKFYSSALWLRMRKDRDRKASVCKEKRSSKKERCHGRPHFLPKLVSHLTQTHAATIYVYTINLTVIRTQRIERDYRAYIMLLDTIMLDQCLQFHVDGGGRIF